MFPVSRSLSSGRSHSIIRTGIVPGHGRTTRYSIGGLEHILATAYCIPVVQPAPGYGSSQANGPVSEEYYLADNQRFQQQLFAPPN